MKHTFFKLFFVLLATLLAQAGCKPSVSTSTPDSAYTGTDCNSVLDNYEFQKQKYCTARNQYVKLFRDYRTAHPKTNTATGTASATPTPTATSTADAGTGTTTATTGGDQGAQPTDTTQQDPGSAGLFLGDTVGGSPDTQGDQPPGDQPQGDAPAGAGTTEDLTCDAPKKYVSKADYPQKLEYVQDKLGNDVLSDNDFAKDLRACETKFQSDQSTQILPTCQEFFTLKDKLDNLVSQYNNADAQGQPIFSDPAKDIYRQCRNGGGQDNIDPQLFAFCDVPCDFAARTNCTRCNVTWSGKREAVVCAGNIQTADAANAFCQRMQQRGVTDCKLDTDSCSTAAGNTFEGASSGTRVSGENTAVDSKSGHVSAGFLGNIEYKGGAYVSGNAYVNGNFEIDIATTYLNQREDTFTASGQCRADTQFKCGITLRAFVVAGGGGEVGVGGAFKLFGNGVEGKAVFTANASINMSTLATKDTGFTSCAGLSENLIFEQCKGYIKDYIQADLKAKIEELFAGVVDPKVKALIDDLAARDSAAREAQRVANNGAESAGTDFGYQIFSKIMNPFIGRRKCCYYGASPIEVSQEGSDACRNKSNDQYPNDSTLRYKFFSACRTRVNQGCNSL